MTLHHGLRWLAVVTFLAYLGIAAVLHFSLNYWVHDAWARSAAGYAALFSRDPHLAAIGFVWNPAPTVLQLPFMVILEPLGAAMFAGPLITVLTGTAAVALMYLTLLELARDRRVALIGAGLFAANPMIVLYAANGMSELPFLTLLVAAVYLFVRWADGLRPGFLILLGIVLGLSFWMRYESLPLVVAALLAVLLVARASNHADSYSEAALIVVAMPMVLSVALWMTANLVIQGDPFFFAAQFRPQLDASGLNAPTAPLAGGGVLHHSAAGDMFAAVVYGLQRSALLAPLFATGLGATAAVALVRRQPLLAGLVLIAAAIPIFHMGMAFVDTSAGWLRFFIYVIPFTFIMPALLPSGSLRMGAMILSGILAVGGSLYGMSSYDFSSEEADLVRLLRGGPASEAFDIAEYERAREIAAYIDGLPLDARIYIEGYASFRIPTLLERPSETIVIDRDRDSEEQLLDAAQRLDYLLVPAPELDAALAQVNQIYPTLYERGASWALLDAEWLSTRAGQASWRLYRVRDQP